MSNLIATDNRWIGNNGIGRYAKEVLLRLDNTKPISLTGSPTSPLDTFRLSAHLRREKPKVFYSPGFNCPIFYDGICILTIHDLIHLQDDSQKNFAKSLFYEKILRPTLKRAPFVFTVSDQSKNAIAEWTQIAPSRIIITPPGVSNEFQYDATSQKSLSLLYVGSSKSHKNTSRMLHAFSGLTSKEVMLQWVGPISQEDLALIAQLRLQARIEIHSNLTNKELGEMYKRCQGTLLPSTIEGFGLPPLESIFSGSPALISNNSPLLSDLSTLSIVVDPYDTQSILNGMERILKMKYDQEDAKQIMRLKDKYNWDNTAAIIAENLNKLI